MKLTRWSLQEAAGCLASAGRLRVNDLLMMATRRAQLPPGPLKVLVVQLAHIGDCVLTTGSICSLAGAYPEHEVHVLASSATRELFEGLPGVSAIHTFDPGKYRRHSHAPDEAAHSLLRALRQEGYHVVVNLRSHPLVLRLLRPGVRWVHGLSDPVRERRMGRPFLVGTDGRTPVRHVVESFHRALERVPLPCPVQGPRLCFGEEQEQAVLRCVPGLGARGFAVLHACAYWPHKGWPADRFARMGELLWRRYRLACVLVGSRADRDRVDALRRQMAAPALNAAGLLRLKETACLISRARLFVGADGGPMHLAGAVGTPALALFGPADPDLYRPWGCRQVVLQHRLPCGPCWQRRCLFPSDNCMARITVEEAWRGAVELLEGRGEVFPPGEQAAERCVAAGHDFKLEGAAP